MLMNFLRFLSNPSPNNIAPTTTDAILSFLLMFGFSVRSIDVHFKSFRIIRLLFHTRRLINQHISLVKGFDRFVSYPVTIIFPYSSRVASFCGFPAFFLEVVCGIGGVWSCYEKVVPLGELEIRNHELKPVNANTMGRNQCKSVKSVLSVCSLYK
jgi:hypothetical protein